MNRERVAITGLGAVSGFGLGVAPLWRALIEGRSAIRDFTRFDSAAYRTHLAATVSDSDLPAAGSRRARRTLADRFALTAASEALAQAQLPPDLTPFETAVYFGSSTGGMFEAEELFAELDSASHPLARIGRLAAQTTGSPAEEVARVHRVSGPVATISSACASGTLALGAALEALRSGEVDLALAGGSDSFCRLTFAGFNSLRAVDAVPCRPFRAERQGMSIGEGAAVLVLERLEDALRRGARPLALLSGAGAACDAHHMTAPDPTGGGVLAAVRAALLDAHLDADAIDFVNAHGTGTPQNDAAEAKMLVALFGDRSASVPMTSTKAAIGHYLGAAGAIEALITVLCLAEGVVPPTPGGGEVDPALGIDLVVGAPRRLARAHHALSTNLAFGGANAACVLSAMEST